MQCSVTWNDGTSRLNRSKFDDFTVSRRCLLRSTLILRSIQRHHDCQRLLRIDMQNNEDPVINTFFGFLFGGLVGTGLGVTINYLFFDKPLLFTGDIIVISAALCAILGWLFGEHFVYWLMENVWWFW